MTAVSTAWLIVFAASDSVASSAADPDLTITKTHTGNFSQGSVGNPYTVTVTNSGAGDKNAGQSVSVTDVPPTGMTVTAMSGTGWTCTTLPTCTRNDLLTAGNAYPALTVTVTIGASATSPRVNSVTVTTAQTESNAANNTATDSTIITQPDLTITKTHTGNFIQGSAGNPYTVTVTNSGAGTKNAGQSVSVTDVPPTGLSVTAMSGTGWTCTTLPTCTRNDVLAAGNAYPAITVTVTVGASAPSPQVNSVTVTTAQTESNSGNNTATDSTGIDVLRIDSVTPRAGRVSGGQPVVLIGAFSQLSTVTMGGVSASWFYTNGSGDVSTITVTTPAHAAGSVPIVLARTVGSGLSKPDAFAYLPTVFSDNVLLVGVTIVRAAHIIELRQAVDALRLVAALPPATWTDPAVSPASTIIRVSHIQELRAYLNEAATSLGYSTQPYTDPGLATGSLIKQPHIEELRQAIRNIGG